MHEVVVLLGAEIEFQEAFGRLRSPTRQDSFEEEFRESLENLERFPYLGRAFRPPFHRLRLSGFPHALYYTVEAKRVFVHAIVDARQDLGAILRRLGLER